MSEKQIAGHMGPDLDTVIRDYWAMRRLIEETMWMAQRYADGRMTYAVSQFNDALEKAHTMGLAGDVQRARDGMFDNPRVSG